MRIENIKQATTINLELTQYTLPRIKKEFINQVKEWLNYVDNKEDITLKNGSKEFNSSLGYTGYDFWCHADYKNLDNGLVIRNNFIAEYNDKTKELEVVWL